MEQGDDQSILYQHTVLCQTCLPYRDPGDDVRGGNEGASAMTQGNSSSYQAQEAILERLGIKLVPPDHPIYSEGPSITLSSRTRGQSPAKATTSTPIVLPNVSGSTTDSENTSGNS